MRRCPRCKETKPLDDFSFDKAVFGGRSTYCKPCKKLARREWTLKTQFNITQAEFDEIKTNQRSLCAICKTAPNIFYMDQNKQTGKIRGLLCKQCTFGIGSFKYDVQILQELLGYLKQHN